MFNCSKSIHSALLTLGAALLLGGCAIESATSDEVTADSAQLPMRTRLYGVGTIKTKCAQEHGTFAANSTTYTCLFPNGSGIVCGGATKEEQNSCDTF